MSLLTHSNSCGVSSIIIRILSSHFFSSFYMVWICYGFIGGPNPLPASFASRYLRVHFLGSMHSCIHTYLHCFCIFKAQLGNLSLCSQAASVCFMRSLFGFQAGSPTAALCTLPHPGLLSTLPPCAGLLLFSIHHTDWNAQLLAR